MKTLFLITDPGLVQYAADRWNELSPDGKHIAMSILMALLFAFTYFILVMIYIKVRMDKDIEEADDFIKGRKTLK